MKRWSFRAAMVVEVLMRLRPSDAFASEPAAITAASGAGLSSGDKTGQTGALALVRQGAERFKEHQYEAARVAFAQAYELDPLPGTLLNLGLAELSANHPVEAAQHLRKYLELPGQPREKKEAVTTTWLPRAEGQVSRIRVVNVRSEKVTLAESGIEIWVDGMLMHEDPDPGEIEVAAGDHEVKVRAGTREQTMSHFAAPGGKVVTLQVQPFEDVPVPLTPSPSPVPPPPLDPPRPSVSRAQWIGVIGLGTLALTATGVAIGFGLASRQHRSDGEALARHVGISGCLPPSPASECANLANDDGAADRDQRMANGFYVAAGGAAALTLAAAFLWPSPERPWSSVRLVPTIGAGTASLGLRANW
jgi:hypothetical protein